MNAESRDRGTILVVDDSTTSLYQLVGLLEDQYRVRVATRGEKALKLACTPEDQPDLILLDIVMPDMDGYEICRALKSDPRTSRIPIIFVTCRDNAAEEEFGLRLGAVDYITKPYHEAIVRARVRTHMNLKRRTDQLLLIDSLTQVPNRRYLDARLERDWAQAYREKQRISLAMIDIDFFKPYNDNYGHGAGDQCLARVAQALSSALHRPMDTLARYGGEEFVALMPATAGEGTLQVAERLREQVEHLHIPHEYSDVANWVTISLGVASCLPPERDEGYWQLVDNADHALYEAKRTGRNRVVLAP